MPRPEGALPPVPGTRRSTPIDARMQLRELHAYIRSSRCPPVGFELEFCNNPPRRHRCHDHGGWTVRDEQRGHDRSGAGATVSQCTPSASCFARAVVVLVIALPLLVSAGCKRRTFTPDPVPVPGEPILLCRNVDAAACGDGAPQVCGGWKGASPSCLHPPCQLGNQWRTFDDACAACAATGVWRYAEGACVGGRDP